MTTPTLTLFHFPGACSSVSLCALEQSGLPYELKLVNIAAGEQAGPAYHAVSALGKVPALLIDGEPLLENAAIIAFVHALRPDAGVLPQDDHPRWRAEAIGGMSFCGGTLHPQVRGLVNPQRVTAGDGASVQVRSRELAAKSFAYADARIAQRGWWLGETMSIVDVYVDWAFSVARRGAFDAARYPTLDGLRTRLMAMPGYARMQEIEACSRAELGL